MNNILIKKFLAIFISCSLLFVTTANAAGTPILASGNGTVSCTINSETDYFPLGDSRGTNVLTKREVVRDCNITVTEQGACIKWRETNEDRSLNAGKYNAYESKNYADSIGSLLAALGSYDQIEHLWSGWKGYCEIGTKSDFSWAEDPMFWASMAMSFIMASTTPHAPGQPDSLLGGTAIGKATNGAAETLGRTISDAMKDTWVDTASTAIKSGIDTSVEYVKTAYTQGMHAIGFRPELAASVANTAVGATAETVLATAYNNIGRCIMATGFDMATTLYEFTKSDGTTADCDPVDEVCGGIDPSDSLSESEIKTIDETQFNDLVTQFSNSEPPQNIYDYVTVIPPSPENGIISYKMKQLNEMAGITGMDQAAMDEMTNKMKEVKMQISIGISVLSMAGCLGGLGGGVGSAGSNEDRASLRAGMGMVIDGASKFVPVYGPLVAAVLKVVLFVATSYKSIDTCNDADDAKEAGKREERTQKAIKFNLCHLVDVECAEYSALATGAIFSAPCVLDGYKYCCYDQIMTKILVEQLKAQLGRDWAHCTGISIRDLNYVSFRQCSNAEMTATGTIDGAHQRGIYDPTQAFQYKSHCIDMGEFLEYLNAVMSTEIDMSDFESFWNDITEQSPYGGTIP